MPRPIAVAAALAAAGAAWLSQGVVAFASADGPRLGLLPISAAALGVASLVGAAVFVVARRGASMTPIALLSWLLLPWLPVPVPAVFLVWAGPIQWLLWAAVGALLLSTWPGRRSWTTVGANILRERPRTSAAVLAGAIFGVAAWQVAPSVPGGDEPHYLVITQSLLRDGDLKIENNHTRGDYQAYFAGRLAPHYIRRGRDGQIYSIHAPGTSVLVAPAFAVGGYRAVVLFLIAIAAAGSALTWHLAWLVTRGRAAAWFGWAAVTLAATTIFHTFTVYPDGIGGVVVLTGVWALLRAGREKGSGAASPWPWLLHGAALAMLPWLHSRFAVLAGTLGALVLLRLPATPNPAGKAVAFLAVPALSALAWLGFFLRIYGSPDPSAPYGSTREFSLGYVPGGLAGLLFDQRFGLFAAAPVLLCAVAGLVVMVRRQSADAGAGDQPDAAAGRRLGAELLFVAVPYLLTVTNYAMWWAGWSAPARFAAPVVPLLAIPCAVAWSSIVRRSTRVIALGSLALTAFVSGVLVFVDDGRLAYNTRDAYALWLDWGSRLADLGRGSPAWFRGRDAALYTDIAIWLAAAGVAWLVLRAIDRSGRAPGRAAFGTTAVALFSAAGMLAVSTVWWWHDAPRTVAGPAQLDYLRRLSREPRALAVSLLPPRLLDRDRATTTVRIEPGARFAVGGGAGRNDQPLLTLPAVPAGRYRLLVRARSTRGWLMVGIGQDQFALHTVPLEALEAPIEIDFPVDVRALIVRGDDEARRAVQSIVVEPIQITSGAARLTDAVARRAVRYDPGSVYFLDERSFPEPGAFWIGGARQASLVFAPEVRGSSIVLHLRNAPIDNEVVVAAGGWRETLALAAGEERRVEIPLAPSQAAALVTISSRSGFRPADTEPGNRDDRFLGVWARWDR